MDLSINAVFTGKVCFFLKQIPSTNDYAKELLKKDPKPADGTVIITEDQHGGRGQRGKVWLSEPSKNITLSIIYFPTFLKADEQFLLNHVISLGICDYLFAKKLRKVKIKWPNDILVEEQKIAGILIENSVAGDKIANSIIGTGLNLNQENFSPEFNATSLRLLTGDMYDIPTEVDALVKSIEQRYMHLRNDRKSHLEEYRNLLFGLGKQVTIQFPDRLVEGTIKGVDRDGRLTIETEEGEVAVRHGEAVVSYAN